MNYRKVFHFDDFMIAFVSASAYGLSFLAADSLGWPEWACLVACFAVGLPIEELAERIAYKKFIQKSHLRRGIATAVIFAIFFICNSIALAAYGSNLESDLMEEFVWVIGFAVAGFLTPVIKRTIHRKRFERLAAGTKKFKEGDASLVELFSHIERLNEPLPASGSGGPSVKVENGVFVGAACKGVESFLGIPYATQPTGALRWKAPVPPAASDEMREARYFGQCSFQDSAASNPMNVCQTGEECLNLNVWRPAKREGMLPVLVIIPNGFVCTAGSASPLYSGEHFARQTKNSIVVSIDCRFGPLGALDFSDVPGGQDYPDAPKLCALDIIEALRWISRNIAVFGGDPERITVLGEEYGGAMVEMLCVAPEAKGLFNRAIIVDAWVDQCLEGMTLKSRTSEIMAYKGLKTMADFCALGRDDIIDIIDRFRDKPCVCGFEGVLGTEDVWQLFRDGAAADIELLMVSSQDQIGLSRGAIAIDFDSFLDRLYNSQLRILDDALSERVKRSYRLLLDSGVEPTLAMQRLVQTIMGSSLSFMVARNHQLAGGTVRMLDWACGSVSEDFGANSTTFMLAAFCPEKSLPAYAAYVDDMVCEIAECFVDGFVCSGDPSIEMGDVKNLGAVEWPAFDVLTYPVMHFSDTNIGIEKNQVVVQSLLLGFV